MLELGIRLKRGLNIVIGPVGTGKTTLCRKLIQNLSLSDPKSSAIVETFLLLDPTVESTYDFLRSIAELFSIQLTQQDQKEWHIKEKIKKFLFDKGISEKRIIALIIDEGQKLHDDCLEVLREFLNYETNDFKLLQIVIFAQSELYNRLITKVNLMDRVNYLHTLKPLSFREMRAMIEHRISIARQTSKDRPLFSFGGMLALYWATAGYPRKVISLCHHIVLMLIIKGKKHAGWMLVLNCTRKLVQPAFRRVKWAKTAIFPIVILVLFTLIFFTKQIGSSGSEIAQRLLSGVDFKKNTDISLTKEIYDEQIRDNFPKMLGVVKLKKRMTIWRMCENIYGSSHEEITRRFISANPSIKNLNNTAEGTLITVPAIFSEAYHFKENPILVSLEESDELASIYYSYINKKDLIGLPNMVFLTMWNAKNGWRFYIVLDKNYKNIVDAQKDIAALPHEISRSSKVLTKWEEGAFCFNRRFSMDLRRHTEGG